MGADLYHEPPGKLGQDIRTFARMAASLREKADTIGWYEQHITLAHDPQAKAIIRKARQKEFKNLAMALELLSRQKPKALRPFSWTWLENLELEAQLGRICWSP